ncbi:hypothetical protein Ancab_037298 [Ancistrocladus abbreviatus]
METLTTDMQQLLNNLPEEMDKTLEQPVKGNVKDARAILRTPADIYDHPTFYSFLLDMPGLDVSNIKVRVENGVLHVTGKKKKKQQLIAGEPAEGLKAIRIERRRARYMRKFTLPPDADQEDVKATYKDGVLTITVAKKLQPPEQEDDDSKPKTLSVSIS